MGLNSEFDCGHDPSQPGDPERLMSVEEVADWLGVSKWTLYHRGPDDDGPPHLKICGRRRYKQCCVRAWIDRQLVRLSA